MPPGALPRSPNGPQEPLPQRRKGAKMAPRSHQVERKWQPEEPKTNPKMIIVVFNTFSLQNLPLRAQNEAKMLPSRNQIRHNMVTVDLSPSSIGPERVYYRRQLRSIKTRFKNRLNFLLGFGLVLDGFLVDFGDVCWDAGPWKMSVWCTRGVVFQKITFFDLIWFGSDFGTIVGGFGDDFGSQNGINMG